MYKFMYMLILLVLLFSCRNIIAEEKVEYVDINGDGKIDNVDTRQQWKVVNHPVTTDIEKQYDINSNGWLEPDESRELLKDRYEYIKQHNWAGADFDLMQEYDATGDGTVDVLEAEAIREDTM